MVAKIKSSFLKKNFQLFCYRNILSSTKSPPSLSDPPSSSNSSSTSTSTPTSPRIDHSTNIKASHSKSFSNINSNSSNSSANQKNLQHQYLKNSKTNSNSSLKTAKNQSTKLNGEVSASNPKLNYYHNNRKHLSKILQSKKLNSGKSNAPNKSASSHTNNNSDMQLLADLKENLDLLHRHQKRSKSSVNFATSNSTINTSNSTNLKPQVIPSNSDQVLNEFMLSSSVKLSNQNRYSNPNIEMDFGNYENVNMHENNNMFLNENNKSNSLSKQGVMSLEASSQIQNNGHSSLYKNQSIASLKLAKKMQLMNKFNNEANGISKEFINGEYLNKNGK
jgi:hypothetical protein